MKKFVIALSLSLSGVAAAHNFSDATCYEFEHVLAKLHYEAFALVLNQSPPNMRGAIHTLLALRADRLNENYGVCPNADKIEKVISKLHGELRKKYP